MKIKVSILEQFLALFFFQKKSVRVSHVSMKSESVHSTASSQAVDNFTTGYDLYLLNEEKVLAKPYKSLQKFQKMHYELLKNVSIFPNWIL